MIQYGAVLPLLCLLFLAGAIAVLCKIRIEWTLPLSVCAIIFVLYGFGFLGLLRYGLYAIWFLAACSALYLAYRILRKVETVRQLLTPGLLLLGLTVIFALAVFRNETIRGWDESAHWLLTTRNCYMLDAFGASNASNTLPAYKEYTPGLSMFHYFFMKTAGHYSNALARIGISTITACLLMPALSAFDFSSKKNAWKAIAALLPLFLLPFLLFRNAYYSTTVDCVLGLFFGYTILTFLCLKGPIRFVFFTGCLATLVLAKDSGLALAEIAAVSAIAGLLSETISGSRSASLDKKSKRAALLRLIGLATLFLAMPLLVKASWGYWLKMEGYRSLESLTDYRIGKNIINMVFGAGSELPAERLEAFKSFYRTMLVGYRAYDATLYYFSTLRVPYAAMLLLITALLFIAKRTRRQDVSGGAGATLGIFYAGNFIWVIGTSLLYLAVIPQGELDVLSSVSRYLGTYLLALVFVGVSLIWMRIATERWDRPAIIAILIAMTFLPNVAPLVRDTYFRSHVGVPLLLNRQTDEDVAYAEMAAYYGQLKRYVAPEDGVVLFGADSDDRVRRRFLFALAPSQCRLAYTANGIAEIYDELLTNGANACYVFLDRDATAESLAILAEMIDGTEAPQLDTLYLLSKPDQTAAVKLQAVCRIVDPAQ